MRRHATNDILSGMNLSQKFVVIALFCAAVAWLAGPAGRFLVVLPLLLVGPGYLLARLLPDASRRIRWAHPVLWIGLSLSLVALLYQWSTLLGLALTPPLLAGLTGLCVLGIIWHVWHKRKANPVVSAHPGVGMTGLLLLILVLTTWTRFNHIQDLALPPWVDSVHHGLMIRVAAETGQAPYSLRPYLPVDDLPYHWGYHVFTAMIMRLSGVSLPQVMLWEGQIFNALHAFTCAALAAYLWRRPLAGLVAALVVGLISIMPAFYLSWGRYTQLTGLLLLPALIIAWHTALRTTSWRWWVCVALLLAGLSLIHVRVLIFALCFLAASGLVWAVDKPGHLLRSQLGWAGAASTLAVVLAAPWLWVVVARTLLPAVDQPESLLGTSSYNDVSPALLWAGQNRLLVALALIAAAWGVRRHARVVVEQVGWIVGVVLLANPQLVGLPYSWLITNDALVISLFIPIAVVLGGGIVGLWDWLKQTVLPQRPVLLRWSGVAVLLLLALWGTWNLRSVINPVTVFATPADAAALDWVAKHTDPDARFLINATFWFTNVSRGSDGGWWLLPLTGRWTSTPPILYRYGPPEYVAATQAFSEKIRNFQADQNQIEALQQLVAEEQITHIYLGSQSGPLTPELFTDAPGFETVYDEDGVTILAVQQ